MITTLRCSLLMTFFFPLCTSLWLLLLLLLTLLVTFSFGFFSGYFYSNQLDFRTVFFFEKTFGFFSFGLFFHVVLFYYLLVQQRFQSHFRGFANIMLFCLCSQGSFSVYKLKHIFRSLIFHITILFFNTKYVLNYSSFVKKKALNLACQICSQKLNTFHSKNKNWFFWMLEHNR